MRTLSLFRIVLVVVLVVVVVQSSLAAPEGLHGGHDAEDGHGIQAGANAGSHARFPSL